MAQSSASSTSTINSKTTPTFSFSFFFKIIFIFQTDKNEQQRPVSGNSSYLIRKKNISLSENTLRRSMSETRLSSFALKALTGNKRERTKFYLFLMHRFSH